MEPANPRLEIFVDLKLSDLIRANLWFAYSQRAMKFSVVMACVVVPASASMPLWASVPAWHGLVPLGLILLYSFTPLWIIYETKRNFESLKDFQKNVQYVFGDEGYEASDGKSSSVISWESIQKALESRHSFNLFISRKLFIVIPRRCLKTHDDVLNFRSILLRALGDKASLRNN